MAGEDWVVVEVVAGDLKAELLRGLLEAQGIPALLSQESAGHSVYPVMVGPLGKVEILVPANQEAAAQTVLEAYHAGAFAAPDGPEEPDGQVPGEDIG